VTANRSGALDGLRGLAALAVVSSHLTGSLGVLPYASGGFIGVLVFFALSGYLITGILWRAPATFAHYRVFVRRRVRRLAPVVVALVLVGVPAMALFGQQQLRSVLFEAALALTQTTAFAVSVGRAGHPAWGPTWSLTVEWVFYLAFPLLLLALRVRGLAPRRIRLVLCAVAVALYLGGLLLSPRAFYLSPVANVAVMVAGAVLALRHADPAVEHRRPDPARAMGALVLLGLLVAAPMASLSPAYRFVVFPAVTLASLVVIHECRHPGKVGRALEWRPLALVGTAAYSLYIWHMPVMWLTYLSVPQLPRPVIGLLAMAILVPVVTASFWLLERPVLRRRTGSSRSFATSQPVMTQAGVELEARPT
jgi:peptidoglycan/LPS O-acetylase OafA/YrhL